jgi:hypothetical protein
MNLTPHPARLEEIWKKGDFPFHPDCESSFCGRIELDHTSIRIFVIAPKLLRLGAAY